MGSTNTDELLAVLKNLKSNIAMGEDLINPELSAYAHQEFLTRLLGFLYMIWKGGNPPKYWRNGGS
jgi:hypothetical protein